MKKFLLLFLTGCLFIGVSGSCLASERASVAECIAKSKLAAEMLLQDKDAALKEISRKDGPFVWKDSYVFVMDLKGKMLAHPVMPGLMTMNSLLSTPDKNKAEPKMLFVEFVVMASTEGEGWVEYMWPKPGSTEPSLKETYVYRVPGTTMFTAAGIYK